MPRSLFVASATFVTLVACVTLNTLTFAQGATGKLKVDADPGRTAVFLDGKYLGPAANFKVTRTYTVPVGSHDILLRDPRYKEVALKVTIEEGKTATLKQKLEEIPLEMPPFGKLRTKGPEKYTAVYVNGRFMGHSDEFDNFAQSLLLKPGDYQVKLVSADGARNHEEKVTITADKTTEVRWDGK